MFQWSSRANIALVRPTYNTTGSGSISGCFFYGSYKTDRMKMESYSSSAGLSRLPDIADPGDHHLPDPRDAPWPDSIPSPTQTLTQAFYMVAWFETASPTWKREMLSNGRSQIFQVACSADSALLQRICLQVEKLLVYKSQKQISKWKEWDNGGTYVWTKPQVWFA